MVGSRAFSVLVCLSLGACFSPENQSVLAGDGTETDTETSGSATLTATGTATAGPTSGPDLTTSGPTGTTDAPTTTTMTGADSTGRGDSSDSGSEDLPPVVDAFSVNGSAMPAEISQGGPVRLAATASDDVGIAEVEFFDGDTSLGLLTAAPYELDVLVTSTDSGSHAYRAVARDTIGQEGDSETLNTSVNIIGGEQEAETSGLVVSEETFSLMGGLALGSDGTLYASSNEDASFGSWIGALTPELNLIWSAFDEEFGFAGPVLLGDDLVAHGVRLDDGLWAYRTYDRATGELDPLALELAAEDGWLFGPRGVGLPDGGALLSSTDVSLAPFGVQLAPAGWTHDLGGYPWKISLESNGDAIVSFSALDGNCANGSFTCIRKVRQDGATAWTVAAGEGDTLQRALFAAAGSDGSVFYALLPEDSTQITIYKLSPEGAPVSNEPLALTDDAIAVGELYADPQGGVIVVGSSGNVDANENITGEDPFVVRLDGDLAQLWRVEDLDEIGRARAVSVIANDERVYVMGVESATPPTFLGSSFDGDLWIAAFTL